MRTLRLMAEFGTWPLWEPGSDHYAVDPETLPISRALKFALKAWADAWDRTLDQNYPPDSKFASPADEEAFEREGRRLRAALQAELGAGFRVVYATYRQPPAHWPFADPRNVVAFTTADVIDRSLSIVYVCRDEDDGAWQFHSINGAPDDLAEHRLVALEEIVTQDPTIAEVADLPLGWRATRSDVGGPWKRERAAETIYIPVPRRGRNQWATGLARLLGPMRFEILPVPNRDPAAEGWQFLPGSVVVCQRWRRSYLDGIGRSLGDPPIDEGKRAERDIGGPVLVALRLWEPEPPLPALNAGVRLVETDDLRSVRAAVEERDPECLVCLAEISQESPPRSPEKVLLDLAVLALGQGLARWPRTDRPSKTWRRIERADAERHLGYVLGHDLAYDNVVLDEEATRRITRSFLALFRQDAQCFTNHDLDDHGSPGSGTPILNATFEGGIGVVDRQRAGLLFVTGED